MEITEHRQGEMLVARVKGAIDSLAAAPFEKRILELSETANECLLLDFSACRYINSTGLRVLIRTKKALEKTGACMRLFGLGPELKSLFSVAGLVRIFPIFESEQDALSAKLPS